MYYTGSNAFASLRQGVVGAWCPSLPNGGSGNTLPDVSGYGNHGTLTNMSPDDWVSGQYGRALDFDGVNDKVASIGAVSSYSFVHTTGILSFAFWAKFDTDGTRLTVAGNTLASAEKGFFVIRENLANYGTNAMRCIIYGGVSGTFAVSGTTNDNVALAGTWDHWCYTSNSSNTTGQWYKNGVAVTTTTRFNPTDISLGGLGTGDSTRVLGIGIATFTSDVIPMDGQLDDVRLYSRALAEPEIRLLASRPGIGLRQESHRNTFYQFPSGARRKRILTGMP